VNFHVFLVITEYFLMFDQDSDQKIAITELKTLQKVMYKITLDETMVEHVIADYDKDGETLKHTFEVKRNYFPPKAPLR